MKQVSLCEHNVVRFRTKDFDAEKVVFGAFYKTAEKIKTKGRGSGKFIHCYTLKKQFKPYLDAWLAERERTGVDSEWLFPDPADPSNPRGVGSLNSWANVCGGILGKPFYFHCLRHYFTTYLAKSGIPATVIQKIISWESVDMVSVYDDRDGEEEIGEWFNEDGVVPKQQKDLTDL